MSNTEALAAAAAPIATLGESFSGEFTAPKAYRAPFQARVYSHLTAVTADDPTDLAERIARFFEEGTELVQSLGLAYGDAQAVVDYVYSRPAGEPRQELGGTMTTLASLATLAGHDMMACGEEELARTWQPEVFAKTQRKRANRHGRGALPGVDEGAVVKVIVHGGQHPAKPSDPDAPIFRREVLISWPEASDDISPEAVATLQASADAVMTGETWETVDSPELRALRDLAHVLEVQINGGTIIPDGVELLIAALAKVSPKKVKTDANCGRAECRVHGPCGDCFPDAILMEMIGRLEKWLAEHPREVVIFKTAGVGTTESLPDLYPWQPAGSYPRTGAHIELEDGKRVRFATYRPLYMDEYVNGWLLYLPDAAPAPVWVSADTPSGRWRHARPLEAATVTMEAPADVCPWQPAGAYPVDGTIIEVEGATGLMRFAPSRRLGRFEMKAGWLIKVGTGRAVQWVMSEPPAGRWRVIKSVEA
ncbi:hypothetical protein [Methylobacterium aquaticum]|uniref:Uncharacterized protein n=1 Tax=Methylobacterium aquaticum TaxID=270351 RepID=A0A0C6FPZ8_9HYPH|nr:hypothetical protein [Methylobacterium aquaticum]BAQ50368.1 hypothetical protein Maq22A_4p60045 [Methylobacterium aquaticum]